MSLFSFADLRFNTATRQGFGVNEKLLGDKTYNYDISRYPIDIGSADKGHYMVIHINTQRKTQFYDVEVVGDEPTIIRNGRDKGSATVFSNVNDVVRGVESLASWASSAVGLPELANSVNNFTNGALNSTINMLTQYTNAATTNFAGTDQVATYGVRTIKRTTETLALYMPDTLNFTHNQNYDDLSLAGGLAGLLGSAGAAGASSLVDSIRNGVNEASIPYAIKDAFKNLSPFIANILTQNQPLLRAGFSAFTGTVQNPALELLYSSPAFRSFTFEFMFYPRDEIEAQQVQKILNTLKFHQAPEIVSESKGFFLIPPSEFDIQFYYNGKENDNIPKISTCVLETIDVDYAPNGFAAYEVPNLSTPSIGKTGMPVAIRLSLGFKETETLTKENYRRKNEELRFNRTNNG